VSQIPKSHKKGVTCIDGILVSQTEAMFASTSSDGTVCIWELVLPLTSSGKPYLSNAMFTLHRYVCISTILYIR